MGSTLTMLSKRRLNSVIPFCYEPKRNLLLSNIFNR